MAHPISPANTEVVIAPLRAAADAAPATTAPPLAAARRAPATPPVTHLEQCNISHKSTLHSRLYDYPNSYPNTIKQLGMF